MRARKLPNTPKKIQTWWLFGQDIQIVRSRKEQKDKDWIPYAGNAGWIVIHRDEQILKDDDQWNLVRKSKLSMVAICGAGSEKMEVAHSLLQPIWPKLRYYYYRCRRPWLLIIDYDGHRPRYEFFSHERIAQEDWEFKWKRSYNPD